MDSDIKSVLHDTSTVIYAFDYIKAENIL